MNLHIVTEAHPEPEAHFVIANPSMYCAEYGYLNFRFLFDCLMTHQCYLFCSVAEADGNFNCSLPYLS